MPDLVLRPKGVAKRPVVVLPELFGMSDHVLAVCERLCADGFPVVCPDLFHRDGTVFPEDDAGRAAAFTALRSVTQDDITAAVLLASDGHPERCGLLGLSVGGHLGFVAATRLPVARVALVYPGWLTSPDPPVAPRARALDGLGKIAGAVLLVVGEDDFLVTATERAVLREQLTAHGHALVSYPGAGHGYLSPGRATYDEAVAEDTWRRVTAHLGS